MRDITESRWWKNTTQWHSFCSLLWICFGGNLCWFEMKAIAKVDSETPISVPRAGTASDCALKPSAIKTIIGSIIFPVHFGFWLNSRWTRWDLIKETLLPLQPQCRAAAVLRQCRTLSGFYQEPTSDEDRPREHSFSLGKWWKKEFFGTLFEMPSLRFRHDRQAGRQFKSTVAKSLQRILAFQLPERRRQSLDLSGTKCKLCHNNKNQTKRWCRLGSAKCFHVNKLSIRVIKHALALCFNINFFHRTFVTYRKWCQHFVMARLL